MLTSTETFKHYYIVGLLLTHTHTHTTGACVVVYQGVCYVALYDKPLPIEDSAAAFIIIFLINAEPRSPSGVRCRYFIMTPKLVRGATARSLYDLKRARLCSPAALCDTGAAQSPVAAAAETEYHCWRAPGLCRSRGETKRTLEQSQLRLRDLRTAT